MKRITFALLLALPLFALSQTTDSTRVKLEYHKKLYDDGLINREEYDKLKAQDLKIVSAPQKALTPTPAAGISPEAEKLHHKYAGAYLGGSLFFVSGIGATIAGAVLASNGNDSGKSVAAVGVLVGMGGIGVLIYGGVVKGQYRELIVKSQGNNVALSYTF